MKHKYTKLALTFLAGIVFAVIFTEAPEVSECPKPEVQIVERDCEANCSDMIERDKVQAIIDKDSEIILLGSQGFYTVSDMFEALENNDARAFQSGVDKMERDIVKMERLGEERWAIIQNAGL